ncbi:flavohemoprotein [Streptomyces sp. PKU-EA00015]|uniref:globin domain-containing protein n=1 Tax=Streptomyces sp. PKU-EA00015 TaxID=2748326 RepID=UPI0015A04F0B|nr:globin domain-containing protein [Streptomyces sp. PKU-EA00015]NWF26783.1 flavohemoprotein [Streptomyces sp. PKU-EA00015]
MEAPATTSADNGASGDNGGGGWFTPRRQPAGGATGAEGAPTPSRPGREGQDGRAEESEPSRPAAVPTRPVSAIRPVGSGSSRRNRPQLSVVRDVPSRAAPEETDTERPTAAAEPDQDPAAAPATASEAGAPGASAPDAEPEHSRPAAGHDPSHGAPEPSDIPVRQAPYGTRAPSDTPAPGTAHGIPPQRAPHTAPAPHAAPTDHDAPASATDHSDPFGPPRASAPAEPPASPDAVLIRRTMAEIAPVADQVTSYFYALLFVRHPELRSLFPVAMDTQRDRLLKALLTAAEHMDNAAVLTDYLRNLGRGHRKYGTQPAHYPAVGEALIGALTRYATATWDAETEAAWVRTYTTISQIMIDAAADDEQNAPAWWDAEVVSHELRTPDIAIITVRPDQPYKFLAGQYTSLETPWWPRIWRHYSFAGAPRPDGLLSFHVKAVPAGWVSNALVHHARPGDVLRLGPPAGSMTVDHTTDNGLLCLGGGTGIAPIKALVEDVATHGERRTVEVFYGARSDHDLYDIDTMLRLQQTHPWLSVRPVVDDRAEFPSAVRDLGRYGPWHGFDAYLSGPPGMIRSGVHALRGIGIPYDRIRHDSLEELVAAAD